MCIHMFRKHCFRAEVYVSSWKHGLFYLYVLGHGGGWGYSAHSVEAIRFSADTDILLGGLGLFGGRGEYTAKIKVKFIDTVVFFVRLYYFMIFFLWSLFRKDRGG